MQETLPIQVVNSDNKTILPTGKLKFEDGKLIQEVEVIAHRTCTISDYHNGSTAMRTLEQGIHKLWLQVPDEFVKTIKQG